ncbi:MAG TPA: serine hydrolase domain-containing protein [Caulobacteraceae bacterium]|nr:serine hydrolase domain-containing protein [Caulobacteraceae bacterium]
MTLARTLAVIDAGMRAKRHVGAQLYVAKDGETVADLGLGLAAAGRPMTTASMMTWLSTSKIATSLLFARIWEEGLVALDDPVAAHIPEFGVRGKERVTLRQVWTHTCAMLNVEQKLFPVRYAQTNAENIALICRSGLDRDRTPGVSAGYQTSIVTLLLAEIIARKRGRDFRELIREELFLPLGMTDCWLGMPAEALERYADRLGKTFDTMGDEPKPDGAWAPDAPVQLMHTMPGGNGRGPMNQLARLLELMRRGGELDGVRIVSPQTVDAMTARHRCGLHDDNFGQVLDWGLGLTLDSRIHHGGATHLYGYGPHASPRAYGHSGFRTTLAFCDPEYGLVVTCAWNGMVADDHIHSERQNALCGAIYEDLVLA